MGKRQAPEISPGQAQPFPDLMQPAGEFGIGDADFDPHTLGKVLKKHFKGDTTKITPEALKLFAEYLRAFTGEALHRASMRAQQDGTTVVDPEHLSKVIPQLLLDF